MCFDRARSKQHSEIRRTTRSVSLIFNKARLFRKRGWTSTSFVVKEKTFASYICMWSHNYQVLPLCESFRLVCVMFRKSTKKDMHTQTELILQTCTTSRVEHSCARKLSIIGSGALKYFPAPSQMDGTNTNLRLRLL
jgi:hypothetical protein